MAPLGPLPAVPELQAKGSAGGVRSGWDLLAGSDWRLHDRDPNGPLMLPLGLMWVPLRAVRARQAQSPTRSASSRSWRGTCRCAAAPVQL